MTLAEAHTAAQPRLRPATSAVGVCGLGSALPERRVANADLAERLQTSDEWIVRRTGIHARHRLQPGEYLADLGATACAGFLVALDEAAALIVSGRARVVLVCAAEALSRITDHDDRSTAVLFGDGAGAVVVAATPAGAGCGTFVHGCDPCAAELFYAGRVERKLRMEGRAVYRHAVARMVQATSEALDRAGLGVGDVDLFVAHQANARIIETAAAELGMPGDRVLIDVGRVANTSSASIPLALAQARRDGRLRSGATVALAAFGAGFVWSAGIIRFKKEPADVAA